MGANENLLKSMQTIADNAVDNAPYDVTRKGRIIESDNGNNLYTVMIDGISYPRISAYGEASFNVGDVVRVLIPGSQPSQMFILVPNDGGSGGEFVPTSRTINGKALSSDIILDGSDINYNEDTTINQAIEGKQDALVSGTNIRTINGKSILGSGNIFIDTSLPIISLGAKNNGGATQSVSSNITKLNIGNTYTVNTRADAFEVSNSQIRCMLDGVIKITASAYLVHGSTSGYDGFHLFKNGIEISSSRDYNVAGYANTLEISFVTNVVSGDYFDIRARANVATTVYLENNATFLDIQYAYINGENSTSINGNTGGGEETTGIVSWADIINKPSTFTPSPHTHIVDQITDVEGLTNMEIEDLLNGQA